MGELGECGHVQVVDGHATATLRLLRGVGTDGLRWGQSCEHAERMKWGDEVGRRGKTSSGGIFSPSVWVGFAVVRCGTSGVASEGALTKVSGVRGAVAGVVGVGGVGAARSSD